MSDIVPVSNGSNGAAVPFEIAPFTTGPGTDFKAVAIGVGANLEGLPAYFVDPLLGTGNLPGLAISSFNNRALRQGTFVASSLCQWISDQSNVYVPDDGSQINWMALWQNALAAFVAALIPSGPDLGAYLPLAGGTMVGNIRFQSGISTILENNTWYYGKDTGGQSRGLIIKASDNNVYINDGSSTYVRFNGTPVTNNALSWSGRDTTGNIRPLIGLLSDNAIHIGSSLTTDIMFDNTGSFYLAGNIVLNNNRYVYAKDTGAVNRSLLGLGTANQLLIGFGVLATTDIYGPTGIGLRHNTTAYGQLTVNGYTYLQGGARSYIPGGNDPHQIYADFGFYARHHYVVGATRDWSCGAWSNGTFGIADETAHAIRLGIDLNGNITIYNALSVTGYTSLPGGASVTNGLTVYNSINLASGNLGIAGSITNCIDITQYGSHFLNGLQTYNMSGWYYFVPGVHVGAVYSRGDITTLGSLWASSWVQGAYVKSTGDVRADGTVFGANMTVGGSLTAGYIRSYGAVDGGHLYSYDYIHADGALDIYGSASLHAGLTVWGGAWIVGNINPYNDITPTGNGSQWVGVCGHSWLAVSALNYLVNGTFSMFRDIAPTPEICLELVNAIAPKVFRTNYAVQDHGVEDRSHPIAAKKHWGFIYDDIAKVMDDRGIDFGGAFDDMGEGMIAYNELTAVLWQAVRELSDEITKLKATLH